MNLFFFFISSLAGARKMKGKLKDYSFNCVRLNSYLVMNQNKETQWNVNARLASLATRDLNILMMDFCPHSIKPDNKFEI